MLSASCTDKGDGVDNNSCTKTSSTNVRSINFFDLKTSSPYYNQVVANFKFNQTSNTYSGGTACPSMDCGTTLVIQNATPKKITFDYNIIFNLNLISWNYQGVATIAANSSLDVGQLNSNCGSISLGAISIQSASVTYQ